MIKLKCHTSYKMFTEGVYYIGVLEKNLFCGTIWISDNIDTSDRYTGVRFLYDKSITISGEGLWPNYRDYFLCKKTTDRIDKINKLGII